MSLWNENTFVCSTQKESDVFMPPLRVIQAPPRTEIGTFDWSICEYCGRPGNIHENGCCCLGCGAPLEVKLYARY